MYRAERNKVFVAVFLLTCRLPARGQVGSAVLLGEARDESSALAPNVKVVAIHEGTSFSRTTTTGPDGSYRLEHLLPGRYTVKAEKNGFQTLTVHPVDLEVQQKGTLDLALTIGATRDSVAVSAIVSPIQAHDASVSYRLDAPEILELPLAVRNVISLVTLGPGAIPRQLGGFTHDVINDVQAARGAVALNPPINGGRSTMNSFLLDGAADTDRNTFAIAVTPPMESVQEFRIASSLGPPDSPQSGGGVMDIITKAGSANYHGSAFEYFQNESTHARNYFDDPTLPRAIFRQQQFGGSLGGPVPALSSTFFFGAYEGLIGKSAKSTQSFVPDPAARAGDFTGRKLIFDPLSARNPFPNNLLPANRIDPIASQFLSLYEPLPNRAGAGGNYVDATPNRNTNHSVSGRIDHQFHNQTQLFGRYTLNNEDGEIAGNFPVRPVTENLRAQQFALGSMFAPLSWLNEARFAFTRLRVFDVPHSAFASNVARQLGVTGLPDDPFTYGLPQFEIVNFSTVTDDPTLPQLQRDNQWSLSDGVTLLRGRHTLKGGIQFTRAGTNYLQSNRVRGEYVYTGAFTGNLTSPGTTGDALADFLLGYPQRTIRTVGSAMAYLRQNVYGAYLQDEWKVNSRLTVNVGARYEYFSPLTDARGNLYNLEYSKLPAPPRLVNVQRSTNPDRNNFAPRAGLAWRIPNVLGVKQDTVFRAGYGIYYSQEIATGTYDLIRNQVRNETNQTDGVTPILTTHDGFPNTASTGFPSHFGMDRNARTPYVQQWTASIQHVLPGKVLIELGYVGTKGNKLGRFRQFNTPLQVETGANLAPRPGDLQSLRTFPDLGPIVQRQNIANSSYHSLQVKAEKRLTKRLGFLTSFVWSKSIDDADGILQGIFDSAGAQDERNLRLERGLSIFNVGRRVSSAFVYSLPGVQRTHGLLAQFVNNWQLSGILTIQDGTPLNPLYFAYDGANTGTPNRPDIVLGQSITLPRSQRTVQHFFNTAAFQTPKPYTFGNAGRNIIPGPGNSLVDLAIHRKFVLEGSRAFDLRTELFNSLNHPNWGIPGPAPDFGPFFGKILTVGSPRRIQFGLRFDF